MMPMVCDKKRFWIVALALLAAVSCGRKATDTDVLAEQFSQPPMAYRPYIWWHWMGSNFSKEGIRPAWWARCS